jgi:hypothetical protein
MKKPLLDSIDRRIIIKLPKLSYSKQLLYYLAVKRFERDIGKSITKPLQFINKLIAFFAFEYNSIRNQFMFNYMKHKAIRLHNLTGRRYHVIPVGKSLMVVDNDFLKTYNTLINKKYKTLKKGKKLTIIDLLKMSYYSTPVQGLSRNNAK